MTLREAAVTMLKRHARGVGFVKAHNDSALQDVLE
jgi:hypothetical protein